MTCLAVRGHWPPYNLPSSEEEWPPVAKKAMRKQKPPPGLPDGKGVYNVGTCQDSCLCDQCRSQGSRSEKQSPMVVVVVVVVVVEGILT